MIFSIIELVRLRNRFDGNFLSSGFVKPANDFPTISVYVNNVRTRYCQTHIISWLGSSLSISAKFRNLRFR